VKLALADALQSKDVWTTFTLVTIRKATNTIKLANIHWFDMTLCLL